MSAAQVVRPWGIFDLSEVRAEEKALTAKTSADSLEAIDESEKKGSVERAGRRENK